MGSERVGRQQRSDAVVARGHDDEYVASKWCNNVLRALCPFCGAKKGKGRGGSGKGCKYLHLDNYVEWPAEQRHSSVVRNLMFEHMEKLQGYTNRTIKGLSDTEATALFGKLAAVGWNPQLLQTRESVQIVSNHVALLLHCHSVKNAPEIAVQTLQCLFASPTSNGFVKRQTRNPPRSWCANPRRASCTETCPNLHVEDVSAHSADRRRVAAESTKGTSAEYMELEMSVALCQDLISALRSAGQYDVLWNYLCNKGWKPQAMGIQSSQEKVEFVLVLCAEALHMMGVSRVPDLVFDTFAVVDGVLTLDSTEVETRSDGISTESVSAASSSGGGRTPPPPSCLADDMDLPPLGDALPDDMTDLLLEVAAMCEEVDQGSLAESDGSCSIHAAPYFAHGTPVRW